MKILVTGSKGFLGRYVVNSLQSYGHLVLHYDLEDGCDILDADAFMVAVADSDLCIHLAAVADLYDAEANQNLCERVNIEGTRIVAECCQSNGVRLLFISTVCAYGNNGCEIQSESSPLVPTEIYAKSKADAENLLSSIPNLDYRIIRPATFYGIGMRETLVIKKFLESSLNDGHIEIHGSGEQTRCYTHVNDVTSAIVLKAEQWPEYLHFNVASLEEVSVNDLVGVISSITKIDLIPTYVPDRIGQIERSRIDISRMESLGWTPQITLAEGVLQLLEHKRSKTHSHH
ncbi:MAG: hypothetical protein CMB73_07635 [Euryarchaeota archaeon]|nr:hypothetical protein [Euryarchaeota archaeon]